jgi:hypothetical protein
MDQAQWDAQVNAHWAALMARQTKRPPAKPANDEPISPLPAGMRAHLLAILDLGYPAGFPQTRLSNAPDGAIAWQVQSMLDDYSDYAAREAFRMGAA